MTHLLKVTREELWILVWALESVIGVREEKTGKPEEDEEILKLYERLDREYENISVEEES